MRTREEIARFLNEISCQLIESMLYDNLSTEEKSKLKEAELIIDSLSESINEELSKNELAALSESKEDEDHLHYDCIQDEMSKF